MTVDSVIKGADRYVVGKIERYDQKNEMFKRARWDPSVKHIGDKFVTAIRHEKDKPGSTTEEQAFDKAGWALEIYFARGVFGGNYGLYSWDSQVKVSTQPQDLKLTGGDPVKMSKVIKKVAKFFGASLVGVCEIDRRWIYSNYCNVPVLLYPSVSVSGVEEGPIEIPEEYKYAVVMDFEEDYEAIKCSPTNIAAAATGRGYSGEAYTTYLVAHYIRCLGYKAIPMGNDTACSIPLAIDAGLGELARNGLLITPEFGPRVRISKIFTNLPLVPDKPIEFGVWEFCWQCGRCADNCPSRAIIYGEPTTEIHNVSNREGLLMWPVNAEKCLSFWAANGTSCSNCIRVCPFNKPSGWTHSLVRWGVKHIPWMDSFFVKMDDLFGYGKQVESKHYWR